MNIKFSKALILAPHTDDAELGCGGTIAKLVEEGCDVYCAAFSACEQSVLPQFPKDILITEVKEAASVLGIKPQNLKLFQYNVRTFNYHRQAILDDILKLKAEINPDIVFIPSINDIHQDHYTIANESVRAFKWSTIMCYELPWNNFNFNTTCFISLTEEQLAKKINSVNVYKSQAHRNYANENFIRSLAITRGVQSNTVFAETFELIRINIK